MVNLFSSSYTKGGVWSFFHRGNVEVNTRTFFIKTSKYFLGISCITLTASSHVVFVELDWVPGTLTKAEDRLHRIGQEASSVLIQHLVLEDSIDAYMAKKVIAKQKQIDKALNR